MTNNNGARVQWNGDLHFPARGDPPKAIEGYLRDKGNPFLFHPMMKPCIFRKIDWIKSCGGMKQHITCSHFDKRVYINDCMTCIVRKENGQQENTSVTGG